MRDRAVDQIRGAGVTAGSGAELVDICFLQRIPDQLNEESDGGGQALKAVRL
jgi:hypothetical protein